MPTQYTSLLDQLESEAYRKGVRAGTKKAMKWFQNRIEQIASVDRSDLLSDKTRQSGTILPGKMFLYKYDPKHKATLPYYDIYPLIFPIGKYKDGHLGINLHYLPPKLRAVILQKLLDFASNKNWDENMKLKMSWQLLTQSTKYKEVMPCVKRYLTKHVRSRFLLIESYDWAPAIFLPVASFQKKNDQHVWADSKRIIRQQTFTGRAINKLTKKKGKN